MNDEDYVYFGYNADGIRTSKTLMGEYTEKYLLDGDKVVEIVRQGFEVDDRCVITYDESGNPFSLEYYSSQTDTIPNKYYYVLNNQGDVIQLRTADGTIVVNYVYDAWGKPVSVTGNPDIAQINPLRYRGYFYDTETGLYYCNSRYYDPEVKRFINADAYMSTGQGFLGHNMFAYCQNNPVMFCDPSGFAVTSYDYAYIDDINVINRLHSLTDMWENTNYEADRVYAHNEAVKIRSAYLAEGEYVGADGYIYNTDGNCVSAYAFYIDNTKYIIKYSVLLGNISVPCRDNNIDVLLDDWDNANAFIKHIMNDYESIIGRSCTGRSSLGLLFELIAHYAPDKLLHPLVPSLAGRTEFADLDNADFPGTTNYQYFETVINSYKFVADSRIVGLIVR